MLRRTYHYAGYTVVLTSLSQPHLYPAKKVYASPASAASEWNELCLFPSRVFGVSNSITFPASSTNTRSDSRIVLTRCLHRVPSVSLRALDDIRTWQRDVRNREHRDMRELWSADDFLYRLVRVKVDSRGSCVNRDHK